MVKRKEKSKTSNSLSVLLDFVDVVDTTFERLTGKPIVSWLKEFQQRPKELPLGEGVSSSDTMLLADAYAILGLPQTATLEEIKRRYRKLAWLFHPDREGGYEEAMRLLNNAYERLSTPPRQKPGDKEGK